MLENLERRGGAANIQIRTHVDTIASRDRTYTLQTLKRS
jgi:hypothetical protein